jgi:hypothetical protein
MTRERIDDPEHHVAAVAGFDVDRHLPWLAGCVENTYL